MIPQFADSADIEIHFQPFQLYPDLPTGDSQGVDKDEYFKRLGQYRNPHASEEEKVQRRKRLKEAWAKDGLFLNFSGDGMKREGRWGNSVDAQRMIMFAREQGLENEMIEGIYSANHERNLPLSDWSVLLEAAEKAGVTGAEAMLSSNWGKAEHAAKVQKYVEMGINSVPVIIINDEYPIHGAPEPGLLIDAFTQLIETDSIDKEGIEKRWLSKC